MSDYDNKDRGALFKNDKEGNENRPDYKGPLNVNGADYDIAAWLKTSKDGKRYMSLSVQPKHEQQAVQNQANEPPPYDDAIDF